MPPLVLQIADAVLGVERMHLQRGRVDQEARADELLVHVVVAQDVADVLAQEALDALAELLHAVDVGLLHAPGAVGASGLRGLNCLIFFLTRKFQETSVTRSLISGKVCIGSTVTGWSSGRSIQPRHAHQRGHAVDLGRARAALAGLAVPAHGEVVGLLGLDLVHGVEHHHALGDLGLVVLELAACRVAAPDAKRRRVAIYFIAPR